jgi:hypothetical protein
VIEVDGPDLSLLLQQSVKKVKAERAIGVVGVAGGGRMRLEHLSECWRVHLECAVARVERLEAAWKQAEEHFRLKAVWCAHLNYAADELRALLARVRLGEAKCRYCEGVVPCTNLEHRSEETK